MFLQVNQNSQGCESFQIVQILKFFCFFLTVIAALLAAVPVLPTYVVCLPGVLDLWLLQENTMGAVLLFLLQFAPTNLVDAAIYEDIHG